MTTKALHNNIAVASVLTPRTGVAAGSGSRVDLLNYESACFIVHVGATSDSIVTAQAQESDDGVAWNAIATGSMSAAFPSPLSSGSAYTEVSYYGTKRYITCVTSSSTATNSSSYSVGVIRSGARTNPV